MAVSLETSWKTVDFKTTSFSYGGYSYNLSVYLQAKYSIVNGMPRIWMSLLLQHDGSGLTSTNKHYRVRQYGKEYPDPADSGYNADMNNWSSGFGEYRLPSESDTVYVDVNYGSQNQINVVGYYSVDFAGVEISLAQYVFVPSPSAPTVPTMSVVVDSPTQATVTYQTASWNDTGGSMAVYDPTVTPTQDLAYSTSLGPNTFIYSGRTPNTTYQLQTRAANSYAFSYSTISTFTTSPNAAIVAVSAVTPTTVTISYTTDADGGALAKNLEYSLDGGATWQTGATVSTSTATSGTYTITGLNNGTTYSIQTRTTTTAGSTVGTTLSATTSSGLYGSVNGSTKQVIKLYGSVNGQTKEITKLYGSVNGVTKRIF